MLPRLLILVVLLLPAGCGESAPTTAPAQAPKADTKLPPEVEFDPATATQKYQKQKTRP
jgi:hypothetical protein